MTPVKDGEAVFQSSFLADRGQRFEGQLIAQEIRVSILSPLFAE
jgi:hypothetical protein